MAVRTNWMTTDSIAYNYYQCLGKLENYGYMQFSSDIRQSLPAERCSQRYSHRGLEKATDGGGGRGGLLSVDVVYTGKLQDLVTQGYGWRSPMMIFF